MSPVAASTDHPPFAGFPPDALELYAGLEADNSRTYWQDHKQTYEAAVHEPMLALLDALEDEFARPSSSAPTATSASAPTSRPTRPTRGRSWPTGEAAAGTSR